MRHVGLTGNIASGKSTVSRLLTDLGATVIDADVLARQAVEPGTPALEAIREQFGDRMLQTDGRLDREALRRVVFHDPVARSALNAIVHPAVGRLRERELEHAKARGDRLVISDIPLLFEVGLEHSFDAVVLVDAPEPVRLARLITLRDLPEADARAMMSAGWPTADKRARATFVIDNDGSLEQLTRRVAGLWQELEALADARAVSH